jgi:uncharacterized protein YcfL
MKKLFIIFAATLLLISCAAKQPAVSPQNITKADQEDVQEAPVITSQDLKLYGGKTLEFILLMAPGFSYGSSW